MQHIFAGHRHIADESDDDVDRTVRWGGDGFCQAGQMRHSVQVVHNLVNGVHPWDALETEHQDATLRWLESTDDVFRRVKPATPARHLVSYVVLLDPDDGSTLLVDHVNAGLWLPPGGHVEPDEHPADTAAREAREELGIEPVFAHPTVEPFFVTVTRTVGEDHGHTDVSLWFLLVGQRRMTLTPDPREFTEARWWTQEQLLAAVPHRFDPHYLRFMAKLASSVAPVGRREIDC